MLVHDMEVSHISICSRCGELKGKMPIKNKNYNLHCRCEKREEKSVVQLPPGYDFVPFIDLCFCCGLTPIKSGVRWSPFFCADCMEMVRSLNSAFGTAVVPVGRHSLMNSVGLKGGEVFTKEKIREFTESLGGLFQRIGLIFDWRNLVVLRTISELDLSDGECIPYEKYILHTDGAVRYPGKVKAFRRLSAYMDVPDWYFAADSRNSFSSN